MDAQKRMSCASMLCVCMQESSLCGRRCVYVDAFPEMDRQWCSCCWWYQSSLHQHVGVRVQALATRQAVCIEVFSVPWVHACSLRTPLCVLYKSEVVASGAIFYAARKLQVRRSHNPCILPTLYFCSCAPCMLAGAGMHFGPLAARVPSLLSLLDPSLWERAPRNVQLSTIKASAERIKKHLLREPKISYQTHVTGLKPVQGLQSYAV